MITPARVRKPDHPHIAPDRQSATMSPGLRPSARIVDELHHVVLGGIVQAVQIRGQNAQAPLLLFLHGGPGLPHMPVAHVNKDLERSFLVVHWDQRGAGKSYSPALQIDDLGIEQLCTDAHELILWLHLRFETAGVVLAGHSWGSVLGAMVAARFPDLIIAYVGIGQVTNLRAAEHVRFQLAQTLARQHGNRAAVSALGELGPPPYSHPRQSDLLERWTLRLNGEGHRPITATRFFRLALSSPVYSWLDLVKIPLGVRFSERCLWDKIFREVDLFRQVPRLDVPVFFLIGRHDAIVSHFLARRYFDALEAPRGKSFVTFDHSGHWPHLEEPELFRAILAGPVRRRVRKDAASTVETSHVPPWRGEWSTGPGLTARAA